MVVLDQESVTIHKATLTKDLQKIKQLYYNAETDSYGPFEGEDAITFLKLLDYEDTVS